MSKEKEGVSRRSLAAAAGATGAMFSLAMAAQAQQNAPIKSRDPLKITKVETFLVKPRWLFLKIHTNAGITGLAPRTGW